MLPQDFCHYLLGVTEMSPTLPPTPEQWRVVTTRLDSVFNKVTPNRVAPSSLAGEALYRDIIGLTGHPPITGVLATCAPSRNGPFVMQTSFLYSGKDLVTGAWDSTSVRLSGC